MLKFFISVVVLAAVIGGCAGIYHLYKVKAKNAAEMAKFESEVPFTADLGKVLVAYYSLSGHTKDIALQIAQKTNADIYKIETVKEYTSPSVYMVSKKELANKNYPELKDKTLPNVKEYDTVFIGGPVWWYTMAPPLFSFLNKVDLSGVRTVPFSTQGSNFGKFFTDFAAEAKNANILQSENFNNVEEKYASEVSNKINAWLNKLGK